MPEAPQPAPDSLARHERLKSTEEMVALQSRLLLGGNALDPTKRDLPDLTKEYVIENSKNQPQTIAYLSKASYLERNRYWQKQGVEGFDNQKKVWLEQTAASFQKGQQYFTNKGWDKSFARLNINSKTFNQQSAEALYTQYFSEGDKESMVNKFLMDIIKGYAVQETIDGKPAVRIDYTQLKQDLPALQWLANIFGKDSATILTQFTDANGRFTNKNEVDKFIAQANEKTANGKTRHNDPDEEEVRLLNFLLSGKIGAVIPSPQPETTKPTQPETPKTESETDNETAKPPIEEQIIPNINEGENIMAAHKFISVLRDPTKYSPDPDDSRFSRHELGFKIAGNQIDTGRFSTSFVDVFEKRYKMPVALYIKNPTAEIPHATLVLKPPYQENGQWKMKVYNPMAAGEEEVILPSYDPDNLYASNIWPNNLARSMMKTDTYDLSISGKPELKPYFDIFMKGKLALLQHDTINCVPYCHFVGALLNALEPGETEFKKEGLEQFTKDFGIKIRTIEEIMEKQTDSDALKNAVKNQFDFFENLANEPGNQIEAHTFTTADIYNWQRVVYPPKRTKHGDDAYRGYLMIEPDDFPKALDILNKIAEERKKRGLGLDFKWLTHVKVQRSAPHTLGEYKWLDATDPRIVIYADNPQNVQDILKILAENPQWQEIENNRVKVSGGKPENAPRRPGTNAFIINGKEYRSLNYNDQPGYSEHEAADPDWRENKSGTPSVPAVSKV